MGDFSRTTFDRMKHYVGVRLQQGVPIVDADWNELEDIRKYELQAFLKWFVGDGVASGNDGFRIAPLAGGGVGTLRIASRTSAPGFSSISIDVGASSAAAALGFTTANCVTARTGSSPAQLTGDATAPFPLVAGRTLVVSADGATPETVTFTAGAFANIGAATAAEVVAAVNATLSRALASVGTGDDFTVMGGDGTPEGAGRCLVDGRDAVVEGRLSYSSQPLFDNAALAAEWGVPVVRPLSAPPTGSRDDLVYLDVWEREVTAAEDDSLVNPVIGVESCVRVRREWAVRVARATNKSPVPGDSDFRTGHGYFPLATLSRVAGVGAIGPGTVTDVRARSLLVPPSTLIEDVLGTSADSYRRGLNRPSTSLREAINALLAGQLPTTEDLSVSPAAGSDTIRRAFVLDSQNGLAAFWVSPRVGSVNQIFGARLDLAAPAEGFAPAIAVTNGPTTHVEPTAVPLPNGEFVVAYQNGALSAANTDVVFKRATFTGLPTAPEQPLSATTGTADETPFGVLTGDIVTFFVRQATTSTWSFRRYRHADNTFVDATPVTLPASAGPGLAGSLHAAAAGGVVWFAYVTNAGNTMTLARLTPTAAAATAVDHVVTAALPGTDPFVVAVSATEAVVLYKDSQIKAVSAQGGSWQTGASIVAVPGSDVDIQPAAARDPNGTVFLLTTRPVAGAGNEIFLRRRDPATGVWGSAQQVISNPANDQNPHPVLVPGQGIWVLWRSDRPGSGNFDLFAKRIVTAI